MLTPRPYQQEAVKWFINEANGRGIIADEMGLGKTCEGYEIWKALGCPVPALILCGKNAQVAWLNQASDWGCSKPILIRGNSAERKTLWARHKNGFVSTTRESLKRDVASGVAQTKWAFIIVDECHKDSNRKAGNFKLLKLITLHCRYVLLMSGSIARRGPQSLWGPLNVVKPQKFSSYWKFVERYCKVDKEGYGWQIGAPQHEDELRERLATVVLRRTKAEVRPEMPSKTRDMTSNIIDMSPAQARLYNDIQFNNLAELSGDRILATPTVLAMIQRLRQILVTPKLVDPGAEYGAGIDRVVELLDDADDGHMVIFTPFAAALPIIRQRLLEEGYEDQDIIQLRGGISVEELMSRIKQFRERRGIAICSIKFAESFDLIPATWGIFLGYEWDAWDNMQAEDRIHRGEITQPVTLYYISYNEGIDTLLVQAALDTKVNNVMAVLKDIDQVRHMMQLNVKGMHR